MRSTALSKALSCCLLLVWATPIAGAQPSGDQPEATPHSLEEFEPIWSASRLWQPPTGFKYTIRRYLHAADSAESIQGRLAAIRDLPDHPDRAGLDRDLARASLGPDIYEIEVWIGQKEGFRYSQTVVRANGATFFADAVETPSARWRLSESEDGRGVMFLFEPGEPDPPSASLLGASDSVHQYLARILTGGLAAPYPGARLASVSQTGDEWHVVVETDTLRFQFVFLASDAAEPRLVRSETRVGATGQLVATTSASGWHKHPSLSQDVAERWEWIDERGRLREALELIDIEPISEAEFASATRVPRPDGQDVRRGPYTYTTVWDYRDDAQSISWLDNGITTVAPIPESMRRPSDRRWWDVVGWSAAGVLAAVLFGIRLYNRRRSTASSQ